MRVGTGNTKVVQMSMTTVGASTYPMTPPPRPSPTGDGQAGNSGAQSSSTSAAVTSAAGGTRGSDVISFGGDGSNSGGATSRDASGDADRLPPPQAATARGTGQRVNIIA